MDLFDAASNWSWGVLPQELQRAAFTLAPTGFFSFWPCD